MRRSFWLQLDLLARRLTPFAITFVLVVMGATPLHVPGLSRVAPMLALMSVYHWAVHRPELMPGYAVFLTGLVHDLLSGSPLGVGALVFLFVSLGVSSQRRFLVGKSFTIIWIGFILVAAGAVVIEWALVSAFHSRVVDPQGLAHRYVLTLGSFPLFSWFFLRWQQAFLRLE